MDPFSPFTLGGVALRNRVLRSATHMGMADDRGRPTPRLIRVHGRLAKGGVGGIISGYAAVSQQGRSPYPGMLMLHDDALLPAWPRFRPPRSARSPLPRPRRRCKMDGIVKRVDVTARTADVDHARLRYRYMPTTHQHDPVRRRVRMCPTFLFGMDRVQA